MSSDQRLGVYAGRERRDAARTPDYREIWWALCEQQAARCSGWLVGRSASGLTMITENTNTPGQGARILVAVNRAPRSRVEHVTVTRTERLSDLLDLVAAEYGRPAAQGGAAHLVD